MMEHIERITMNPGVMGGKPCIRGMRLTVGTVVGLMAAGHGREEILDAYPYLEAEDLQAALSFAAQQAGLADPQSTDRASEKHSLLTRIFEAGLRELHRERILDQYLREQMSREEAVLQIGQDWVDLAERQRQAVEEDIAWALGD